jgi:hypothetical protein
MHAAVDLGIVIGFESPQHEESSSSGIDPAYGSIEDWKIW